MARVLVIDGYQGMRAGLTAVLELEAHEVHSRATLADGLRLLQEEPADPPAPFDLVLADFPRFTPSALAPLQALTQAAPEIPIMVTAGFAEGENAENLDPVAVGVAAILLQPFDPMDLLAQVRGVLAGSHAGNAASARALAELHALRGLLEARTMTHEGTDEDQDQESYHTTVDRYITALRELRALAQ